MLVHYYADLARTLTARSLLDVAYQHFNQSFSRNRGLLLDALQSHATRWLKSAEGQAFYSSLAEQDIKSLAEEDPTSIAPAPADTRRYRSETLFEWQQIKNVARGGRLYAMLDWNALCIPTAAPGQKQSYLATDSGKSLQRILFCFWTFEIARWILNGPIAELLSAKSEAGEKAVIKLLPHRKTRLMKEYFAIVVRSKQLSMDRNSDSIESPALLPIVDGPQVIMPPEASYDALFDD